MILFDEGQVRRLFDSSLEAAKLKLRTLEVCSSDDPAFRGLTGWVFEQTVVYCLRKEIEAESRRPEIRQQVSLGGRASADCAIGSVAIEIKARGLFDRHAAARYHQYSLAARSKGYSYIYVTLGEKYAPYRSAIADAVGHNNAFFLDTEGQWEKFVQRIFGELQDPTSPRPQSSKRKV